LDGFGKSEHSNLIHLLLGTFLSLISLSGINLN